MNKKWKREMEGRGGKRRILSGGCLEKGNRWKREGKGEEPPARI